ncbi:MAG: HupE/UreJ family protein [Phycisphaerae bacterium]|nr:HupE/UreJ family protein [Phycisphaerae bacterium]
MLRAIALLLAGASAARGHEFTITDTLAILKSDGTFVIDLRIDVDALVAGVPPATPAAEVVAYLQSLPAEQRERDFARVREVLPRRLRIAFDEEFVEPIVTFPEYLPELAVDVASRPAAASPLGPTIYGLTARFSGSIPAGAKSLQVRSSRFFNSMHLTIFEQSTRRVGFEILSPGGMSSAFALTPPPPLAAGLKTDAGRADATALATDSGPAASSESAPGSAPSVVAVMWQYTKLGFEHILPKGLDHILFVLALFLLSTSLKPLVSQITAFTIAHSITLALAIFEIVRVQSWFVEATIAASIAFVAIENLLTSEVRSHRLALVFTFGLLHGLGFASVLTELGLPSGQIAPALIAFNVGVEGGQLAVVASAMLTIGWFRRKSWYRPAIVIPASLAIAAMGLYWSYERLSG